MKSNLNDILSKTTIGLVVFDLDGTLYEKKGLARRMFFSALKDWKLMLAERKTRKLLRGEWYENEDRFYEIYFKTMSAYCNLSAEESQSWYFDCYLPLMVATIQKYHMPVKWLAQLLKSLRAQGIKMVVLSDYEYASEKLNALGIDNSQFDWVISAPKLGGLKPAHQVLEKVLETMGYTPKQCLVIGDREDTDGQLAQSVGTAFYRV